MKMNRETWTGGGGGGESYSTFILFYFFGCVGVRVRVLVRVCVCAFKDHDHSGMHCRKAQPESTTRFNVAVLSVPPFSLYFLYWYLMIESKKIDFADWAPRVLVERTETLQTAPHYWVKLTEPLLRFGYRDIGVGTDYSAFMDGGTLAGTERKKKKYQP